MAVLRVALVLLLLVLQVACAPRLPDLPRVEGGEPLPEHAVRLRLIELERGHLSVQVGRGAPTFHHDIASGSEDVYSLVTRTVAAAASQTPGVAEVPVVLMSEREHMASFVMDVLVEPARIAAEQDPRIRTYLGAGDVTDPRMVDAPPTLRKRWSADDGAVYSLAVSERGSPETNICAIPPGSGSFELLTCSVLVADRPPPLHAGPWPPKHPSSSMSEPMSRDLAIRICDAIEEPFDILWEQGSLERLVEVLLHDPRPPRCRGRIWVGDPWQADHHGVVRVGDLRGWRRGLTPR